MNNEEKEWDDALLDLVIKGLVKIVHQEDGTVGFIFNHELLTKYEKAQ